MQRAKLTDLEAQLISVARHGRTTTKQHGLLFWCPVCNKHYHFVPYDPGVAKATQKDSEHVWGHAGGNTIEDFSLRPSYRSQVEQFGCTLHCWIRDGYLEILGDSKCEIMN